MRFMTGLHWRRWLRALDAQCAAKPASDATGDAGFTLVEVMAASAILSTVVLCLIGVWTTLDRTSFDLLLRQKAAFVLNGEVERLTALYTATAFGNDNWGATGSGSVAYPPLSSTPVPAASVNSASNPAGSNVIANSGYGRRTYYAAETLAPFATASTTSFAATDSAVLVLNTRNWVWLDQARSLVARLSWLECPMSGALQTAWVAVSALTNACTAPLGNTTNCYPYSGTGTLLNTLLGTRCAVIVAVLDYPFSYNGGNPLPLGASVSTLTLSTAVGRRL